MKREVLIIIVLLISAFQLNAGVVGNTSMNIATSARVAGMGHAFTGVANDGAAMEFNPAGLYQINKYYTSFMHLNLGPDVVYEYLNGAMDTKFGTVGAGLSLIHLGEEEGVSSGFSYFDLILSSAFSRKIYKELSAGITAKFFTSSIGGYSARTIIFDIGTLYKFKFLNYTGFDIPNVSVGLCVKNIGPGLKYGRVEESLPMVKRFGIGYMVSDTMTISADLIKEGEFPLKYGFGIENITGKFINLRLGYQGGETKTSFGGGIGLLFKIKRFMTTIDFTYLYENAMDRTVYITFSFQQTPPSMERFGFRTDKILFKTIEKTNVMEKVTVVTQGKKLDIESSKLSEAESQTNVGSAKTNIIEKVTVVTQIVEGEPVVNVVTQQIVTVVTQRQVVRIGPNVGKISVVVLDFENTGNSKNWEFLSETIADSVSSTIAEEDFITVQSRLMLKDTINKLGIKGEEIYKIENLKKLGKALNVNVIVKGSFIEINRRLQITTEVFDLETGTVFASSKVLGVVGMNMFDLMDKTAEAIVKDLKKYSEK